MITSLPAEAGFKIQRGEMSVELQQKLPEAGEPGYFWVQFDPPHRQDGRDFFWLVVRLKLTKDMVFEQYGEGFLCETKSEMQETLANLTARDRKYLVNIQMPGFGTVGWVGNFRRAVTEIRTAPCDFPDGKKGWMAFECDRDLDTKAVKILRRQETTTEGEAQFIARQWADEKERNRIARLKAAASSLAPPRPPAHCTALSPVDLEDLAKAKLVALKRQWPHCFELFEKKTKTLPNQTGAQEQAENAYALDLVGQGSDLPAATGGRYLRPDIELISAFYKAAKYADQPGKSKTIEVAIYLIAFNWELGWCYLPDAEIAGRLGELLETPFTPEQVKKLRSRTLGLVAKHLPGPPPKFP